MEVESRTMLLNPFAIWTLIRQPVNDDGLQLEGFGL